MQVCNVPDPSSFSDHISISHKHADKNHSDLLVLGKIWKDRQKCAVCTGGQRAVTLCAGVENLSKVYLKIC